MESKFIILIVIVLGIVAISQLARVYELAAKLRGKKEEDISESDNRLNARLMFLFMVVFFASVIYFMNEYGKGLQPEAASEHGVYQDWLMGLNMAIILIVFFITNFLLFFFASKYYKRKGSKAYFFPHDNKLELIWTVVPSIVLAVIIILGLKTWNDVTSAPSDEAERVELYSKQFSWTARYSGADNVLGDFNYKLVNDDVNNPLGIVTRATMENQVVYLKAKIADEKAKLNSDSLIFADEVEYKMHKKVERLSRVVRRLEEELASHNDSLDIAALDDKIVRGDLHLKVNQEYEFQFRAEDVIHSAYFPHFRAQMNTVPGMKTRFKFKPTITTKEMRERLGDDDFSYVLFCNKICGASHSNMYMLIQVDDEATYDTWLSEQPTFGETVGVK
ncbi:MAG: cytochrome c oxidase subunit II [Crocinitomicaceae bacterium]|nr:cytochrome c oxidase subunit II [Crocinitomicaceae bacterium]